MTFFVKRHSNAITFKLLLKVASTTSLVKSADILYQSACAEERNGYDLTRHLGRRTPNESWDGACAISVTCLSWQALPATGRAVQSQNRRIGQSLNFERPYCEYSVEGKQANGTQMREHIIMKQ